MKGTGGMELLREENIEWDYVTDVLVLGYGGAGACAAIAAKDRGAEVIILEKAPFGGGNTACSVGNMLLPNNVAEAMAYYKALSFDTVSDQDLIRTMAEAMVALPERLKEWGIDLKIRQKNTPTFPTLPGARCIDHWSAGLGESLFNSLSDLVSATSYKILFESPAKKILKDPKTGNIRGVLAEQAGKRIFLKAQKGVVLTTGGYENNFEMQGHFHFPGLKLYPFGTPYNTGDGVKMASELGARPMAFCLYRMVWAGLKRTHRENRGGHSLQAIHRQLSFCKSLRQELYQRVDVLPPQERTSGLYPF